MSEMGHVTIMIIKKKNEVVKLNYYSQTNNTHDDFYVNKDIFEFSEYPQNSRFTDVKKWQSS